MLEHCAKIFLMLFDNFEKEEAFHGVLSSTSFFASHRASRYSKVRIREQNRLLLNCAAFVYN